MKTTEKENQRTGKLENWITRKLSVQKRTGHFLDMAIKRTILNKLLSFFH